MACDARVVSAMDVDGRKSYSAALLHCNAGRSAIHACPVAFAEGSVKQRILRVLHYRKPGFWITLAAVIALIFVGVFFMTNPADSELTPSPDSVDFTGDRDEAEILARCQAALQAFQSRDSYHVTIDRHFSGGDSLNTFGSGDYWRAGEDWLTIIELPEVNGGAREYYLEKDGIQYRRGTGAAGDDGLPYDTLWQQATLSSDTSNAPWLREFSWADSFIVLLDHQTAPDTEVVTFRVLNDPNEADMTSISFYLNESGGLEAIARTVFEPGTGSGDSGSGRIISETIQIHDEEKAEILQKISEASPNT